MPAAEEILAGLHHIANDLFALAVVWHAAIYVVIAALLVGWRPSQRYAALLSTLPLVSVAVAAFVYGNPFNGAVFAALAALLANRARRLRLESVASGTRWSAVVGAALVAFGSVYPHFLAAHPAWAYVIAAPVGLVPCPSLALVIGFTLLAGGFADRIGSWTLSAAGVFYGLFGTLRLGVRLDIGLFAGALLLAWVAMRMQDPLQQSGSSRTVPSQVRS